MHIEPITCYRPRPDAADAFACLPYDVFEEDEARAYVEAHPDSFLAIDRPETSFAPGQDPYAPEVYERAGALIRSKGADGTLLKDQTPCLYLYRLEQDGHAQTGIVCACAVADYEKANIRRHEKTRPDKTADRVNHIRACAAQTGPVFLTYRDSLAVDVIVDAARSSAPLYDFVDAWGVRQTIWRVARTMAVEALQLTFSTIPHAYIADGHHRASAAAAFAHEKREAQGNPEEQLPSDSFLAVLFPASQLTVLAYNRVVRDTFGHTADELLAAIQQAGFVLGAPQAEPATPLAPHQFGLWLAGSWYPLSYQGALPAPEEGPAAALDVSLLQDRLLRPLLGIDDPRTSERISFVGGNEPLEALAARAGSDGVAFALYPTSVDDLMAVSDAGELMPPKSTWFEPKLRSGLFIRRV